MQTSELVDKIKEEQMAISNAMLEAFKQHGWDFPNANSSDIHARTLDNCSMTIDDGRCPDIVDALVHIYGQGGKIFEGRLSTPEEVVCLMKMLGFTNIDSE